jgi:hypothetical protein
VGGARRFRAARGRDAGEPNVGEALIGVARGNGKSGFGSVLAWDGLIVDAIALPRRRDLPRRERARASADHLPRARGATARLAAPRGLDESVPRRDRVSGARLGAPRALRRSRFRGRARPPTGPRDRRRNPRVAKPGALLRAPNRDAQKGLASCSASQRPVSTLNTIAGELYLKGRERRDPRFLFLWPELTDEEVGDRARAAPRRRDREARQSGAVRPAEGTCKRLRGRSVRGVPPAPRQQVDARRGALAPGRRVGAVRRPRARARAGARRRGRAWTTARGTTRPRSRSRNRRASGRVVGVDRRRSRRQIEAGAAVPRAPRGRPDRPRANRGTDRLGCLGEGFPDGRVRGLRELRVLGGDPWRMSRSLELLQERGILAIEYPMTNARMAPASQRLYDGIVSRRARTRRRRGNRGARARGNREGNRARLAACGSSRASRRWTARSRS